MLTTAFALASLLASASPTPCLFGDSRRPYAKPFEACAPITDLSAKILSVPPVKGVAREVPYNDLAALSDGSAIVQLHAPPVADPLVPQPSNQLVHVDTHGRIVRQWPMNAGEADCRWAQFLSPLHDGAAVLCDPDVIGFSTNGSVLLRLSPVLAGAVSDISLQNPIREDRNGIVWIDAADNAHRYFVSFDRALRKVEPLVNPGAGWFRGSDGVVYATLGTGLFALVGYPHPHFQYTYPPLSIGEIRSHLADGGDWISSE